jgi:4-amino-4-deoxy-L-arabinose transferase-like glycosyltransferase
MEAVPMPAPREKSDGCVPQILLLATVTIACLAPFAGKAFNIDDPLFLWAARQIHSHPFDFYGFTINWYGHEMPASQIIKNPPLASYYIALAARWLGWSETALHIAFLLPAVAGITGTYLLAREFSVRPLEAALVCLLTPVFLLSSTTVMCDTMMLSLYVWSILLWIRGLRADGVLSSVCAAFLVAICSLTKYFGMSLILLLLVYSLTAGHGKKHRAALLSIPVFLLSLYQWATHDLYGRGLLLDAAAYATEARGVSGLLTHFIVGLSFTGGCLISSLFYAPLLWRRRVLVPAISLVAAGAVCLTFVKVHPLPANLTWGFALQFSLFIAAGINVLFLAGRHLRKRREADSLLLFLWIAGTFLFATFVNWSTNGRSILPMAPAVGILVMRSLEETAGESHPFRLGRTLAPLVAASLVALTVAWADFRLAETARAAAAEISRVHGRTTASLWFQGHWGFQYYMEKHGGKAFDVNRSSIRPGDLMVIPGNNANIYPRFLKTGTPVQVLKFTPARFLSTISSEAGAGFYSQIWGPLPFAAGRIADETYHVLGFGRGPT